MIRKTGPAAGPPIRRLFIALFLALSAINLALMIPGGFVETRDFSAYPAAVLILFNVFLTALGLGSLLLAWRTPRGGVRPRLSWVAAWGFAGVYLLDLFAVFPVTPEPMSPLLERLEWAGIALACLLGAALVGVRPAGARRRGRLRSRGPLLALGGRGGNRRLCEQCGHGRVIDPRFHRALQARA